MLIEFLKLSLFGFFFCCVCSWQSAAFPYMYNNMYIGRGAQNCLSHKLYMGSNVMNEREMYFKSLHIYDHRTESLHILCDESYNILRVCFALGCGYVVSEPATYHRVYFWRILREGRFLCVDNLRESTCPANDHYQFTYGEHLNAYPSNILKPFLDYYTSNSS